MTKIAENTICLGYDGTTEEAARFYAATFPDSSVGDVYRAARMTAPCMLLRPDHAHAGRRTRPD